MKPNSKNPSWRVRRIIIFGSLAYCASLLWYLAVFTESTPLREQVVLGLLGLSGTVITGYLGFATWDDKNVMRRDASLENAPYDEELE